MGFANYYREFIPWHAKLLAPMHAITRVNATFAWGAGQQQAFNEMTRALLEATALAQPESEVEIVLDTDASAVPISGILHQWQGPPGQRRLKPCIRQQKADCYSGKVRGAQAGDVCCLPFHCQKSIVTFVHGSSPCGWTTKPCHGSKPITLTKP